MLKIRENVDLKELEKYGFKKNSNFPDGWAMVKTYIDTLYMFESSSMEIIGNIYENEVD